MTPPAGPRLVLDPELTVNTAADLRQRLLTALDATDLLRVDLSAVTELDTAGLQVLLLVAREAESTGRRLRFEAHPPAVTEVLSLTRLTSVLDGPEGLPGPAGPEPTDQGTDGAPDDAQAGAR